MEIGQLHRAQEASSSPASTGPRGPAPAPTPAAPELRLMRFSQPGGSFSSSAIFPPAAAPAPPPPHRLCRPPTAATDWLGLPCTRAWGRRSLGTPTARTGLLAFYCTEATVGGSSPHLPGSRPPAPRRPHPTPPPSSPGPVSGGEGRYSRLLKALWRASKKSQLLLCVLRRRAHPIGYCSSNSRLHSRFRRAAAPYTEVSGWCGGNGS